MSDEELGRRGSGREGETYEQADRQRDGLMGQDREGRSHGTRQRDGLMGQDIGLGQHLELQQQAESVGGNPV